MRATIPPENGIIQWWFCEVTCVRGVLFWGDFELADQAQVLQMSQVFSEKALSRPDVLTQPEEWCIFLLRSRRRERKNSHLARSHAGPTRANTGK
jgi:hypothetical protein